MKFRKRLFSLLAVLVVLNGIVWITSYNDDVQQIEVQNETEQAARDVGEGIGVTIILCLSIPFFVAFALLAWRNSVGLRAEERHQEHIEALRQQRQH